MKKIFHIIIVCLFFLCLSCASSENPNKQRVSKVLNEIQDVVSETIEKQLPIKDLTVKLQKIEKSGDNFPESREEVRKDVNDVINFFNVETEMDKKLIEKYETLLKLGLIKSEEDCIEHKIKLQLAHTNKSEIVKRQYNLFRDEHIKDKETLDTQYLSFKEKVSALDKEIDLLEEQDKLKCVRKN